MLNLRRSLKKKIFAILATGVILGAMPITAYAATKTVYYKGSAVYWQYGRKWAVYSYSKVQSSEYEHSATANSTSSGWQDPGILAEASEFVGAGTARAYWNCR
ncbi:MULTISPECIES: hypothetical protein [unclassified Parvimonas]|uniref:hypothetical protein n=1 Tax=unclassified Parvimonas TaxID=1151464 RepID=UPI002B46915E|nr:MULTISPECIES: hypothetical protein [unclassified Parvimonas]MEB3025122.1 hypothetical protein [Parvimonas sp. M13]MEB3089222.1 hypothetical protein [Parvimonas sp. M20]